MAALRSCRVLVTATSFGQGDPGLKSTLASAVGEVVYNPTGRPLKAAELREMITDIDGLIAGLDEIDASVIQAANRLRVIARYGVGVNRIDVKAATERGIVVTNTPGANSVAVAELTIAFILALARNLCAANEAVRRGEWPRLSGIGLRGKTIGLIGLGSIGREVALRLRPFGCTVLARDPMLTPAQAEAHGAQLVDLDTLLARSDFVSLHLPLLPSTQGMVNEDFLRRMKPGAFLVNTARGELLDEAAVRAALEGGHLRGAALDAFAQEPPGADHPLLQLPQLIASPHAGAHTDEAIHNMGQMSVEACLAVLRGERPPYVVNPQVYDL